MKRVFWYVALPVVFLLLGASSTFAAPKALTFGFVAGVQDPFYIMMQKGAEAKALELGGIKIIAQIPGQWSVDAQAPMWRAMAARKVDLVFGAPVDRQALIPVLKDVHDRGTPVITVDTYIADGDYTSGPTSFVLSAIHTDNIGAGEQAGNALAALIGKKGNVYLQEFHVGVSTSDERSQGFLNAIAKYPDIKLVAKNSCDDDQDKAAAQTAAVLKAHPDIVGIFGNNLFAAEGAAVAVHNAGLSGAVKVVGFDVTPGLADMISKGWVAAAVTQQPYKIGQTACEWAASYLREGKAPPKKIDIESVLFTKENVNDPGMDKYIYK